jgi:hypothetical protein
MDFNYGLNTSYNFGPQYVENHADETPYATKAFPIPGLDSADDTAASSADDSLQAGLADDQKAGLVQKNFGNQYIYDEGITRTWAAGPNANGPHKEINFGGRYIENQLCATRGDPDPSGINGIIGDQSLAIKTVGDEARYNEGVIDIHHKGDMKHIQTGAHTSEITGDDTIKIVSGPATVEKSICGGKVATSIIGASEDKLEKNLTGDLTEMIITTGKMTYTYNATAEYSVTNLSPVYKSTNTGNSDFFNLALKSETVLGLVNDNFIGGKVESFTGLKTTMTTAGEVNIGKAADLKKHFSKLDQATAAIEKHQSKIVDGAIAMFKSKINMLG